MHMTSQVEPSSHRTGQSPGPVQRMVQDVSSGQTHVAVPSHSHSVVPSHVATGPASGAGASTLPASAAPTSVAPASAAPASTRPASAAPASESAHTPSTHTSVVTTLMPPPAGTSRLVQPRARTPRTSSDASAENAYGPGGSGGGTGRSPSRR